MLKKIRWRFIDSAMAAFLAVIFVLLCCVNIGNYWLQTRQLDRTAERLSHYDAPHDPRFGNEIFDGSLVGPFSPEAPYMIRFFTVQADPQGGVETVDQEFITAISAEEASKMAADVLDHGHTTGFCGVYRYGVFPSEAGSRILFLNAEGELRFIRTLLWISLIALLVSMMLAFALVVPISKLSTYPFEKNLEMQKQFVTDAGHELKTPLTSIITSADILALEFGDNKWIGNIQRQSTRLSGLVAQLTSLARLDEAAPFPEMEDFSLSEAAWETSEPFNAQARAEGKSFERKICEELVMHGNKDAMQQLCSILLDNSIRHSDADGNICLQAYRRGKNLCIEVSNTYDRPLPEDLDRLFERFYRADSSRSSDSGGYGVGLAIARATAEAHGGKLTAERIDEKKICFRAVLP